MTKTNIIDYLYWRGDFSFVESHFNEIDNLILSNLCYVRFTGIIKDNYEKITISRAATDFLKQEEALRITRTEYDIEFLKILMNTRRFGNLHIFKHRELYSKDDDIQFGAISIMINPKLCYISYRGTDNFIGGWKEDLDMSYSIVPSQTMALDYLREIIKDTDKGIRFMVGGHSKGGNLAMFACAFLSNHEFARIERIYNNDGPGFDFGVMPKERFSRLLDILVTYTPKTSIVASFFEQPGELTVIESCEKNLMSHDPYTWIADVTHFVYLDDTDGLSKNFKNRFDQWINSLSYNERKHVIETLYDIILKININTLSDIIPSLINNYGVVISILTKTDEKTGRAIKSAINVILSTVASNLDDKTRRLFK